MNYNRRANRPDGNVYREMRRRTLRGSRRDGHSGRTPVWIFVAIAILACGTIAGWVLWK